jgi:Leucine-rich repeat (LRR) protein
MQYWSPDPLPLLTRKQQRYSQVLTELPADLARLKNLTTLIVSHNSLTALPEEMKALKQLKNFEFTDNKVKALPPALGSLANLEVLNPDPETRNSKP